ncbi:HEAT repeat domain-containing protein [Ktedonobacter robiniae]|uniref:HEAT repeat domain-containing protein n=1 Tax=Ktedonobacter robiniae TaxID=2778365 RepID=A0ABQ3UZY4_9CHLR|nr:hypothetical protein [Ktedonobacter robiniae]GHO58276.1 hypothetical protein KSB_67510 [Ktedonobacter robiniae]
MLEQLLDEALQATRLGNKPKADQLLYQLADASDGVVDVLVKALRHPGKARQALAIRALHLIGYPKNEPAIPELIYHIGDPNLLGWSEAVETLTDMGPDVIVPHLIQALLEKGPPYHADAGKNQTWAYDVEGLCTMLSMKTIADDYALRCCPTVHCLLSQAGFSQAAGASPDVDTLLDVVERAGDQVAYVLPTLIALVKKQRESEVGKHAQKLISAFPEEALTDYKLQLRQL